MDSNAAESNSSGSGTRDAARYKFLKSLGRQLLGNYTDTTASGTIPKPSSTEGPKAKGPAQEMGERKTVVPEVMVTAVEPPTPQNGNDSDDDPLSAPQRPTPRFVPKDLPKHQVPRQLIPMAGSTSPDSAQQLDPITARTLFKFDELVGLDQAIGRQSGEVAPKQTTQLRTLLKEYQESIIRFRDISQMKRPDMEGRGELVQTLSDRLRNRYYKDAPDALGFLDLTPTALGVEPDPIRVLITKTISRTSASNGLQARSTFSPPSAHRYGAGSSSHSTKGQFLDLEKGHDDAQDHDELYEQRTPGVTGTRMDDDTGKDLEGVSRPIQHQITAFVDYLSRLLVTIMASLFLIVPMVVLSYVEPKWARLLSASLFVLLFAVYVSLVSKGSNQEMVMSSAAYADWTNLMCYDLHGILDRNNSIGAIAQANTNLAKT
ncbi:hypothetical protein B0H67DRAFT_679564 [Lasiosphaeris hirsuta]|uniref:DUF6594 domain-containing protein n=1 Tax=Lasiosphaeris hirsuta TaxID=260670 RepID=A0AA40BD43_9PEZI|nr:hypothetical protein B0H67DRAFT_679564 [Lasiosphaeris hirsuta]